MIQLPLIRRNGLLPRSIASRDAAHLRALGFADPAFKIPGVLMSDPKSPFEMMMTQAQELAKAFNPALESFSPKNFEQLWPTMPKEFMELSFGKGINKDGLDARTRLLLTLAGLTMLGAQSDTQIRLTVRHALEAGATADEVAETIAMMSIFAGIPSMNRAMGFAREILEEIGPEDQAE